ncbi:hypothetical protein BSKO_13075 [Bryopsis sp. KO-2023]|nr:hypothetical protein BSKO_13075 [Bryopsis sp. KO-2023]
MATDRFERAEKFISEQLCGASDSFEPKATSIFDTTALHGIRDFRYDEGSCRCIFPVTERAANTLGRLHGGCAATLVDTVTSGALLTVCKSVGLSVHLWVTYLAAAKIGEDIEIHGRVVKVGKTLAYIEADLRRKSDGKRVAKGGQVKFILETDMGSTLSKL